MSTFHLALICAFHLPVHTGPSSFFSTSDLHHLAQKSHTSLKRGRRASDSCPTGKSWDKVVPATETGWPSRSFPKAAGVSHSKVSPSHLRPPSATFWSHCAFSPLSGGASWPWYLACPSCGQHFQHIQSPLLSAQVPHSKGAVHFHGVRIPHSKYGSPK